MILSKSYKDAMDRIKMSPELKERIISASEKGEKKRKYNFAYIGAAAAGLAACIALVFTLSANRAEKTAEQPVEVAESVTTIAPEPAETDAALDETEAAEQTDRIEVAKAEPQQSGSASAPDSAAKSSGGTASGAKTPVSASGIAAAAGSAASAPSAAAPARTEPKAAAPEVSAPEPAAEPPAEDTRVMTARVPETAAKDTRVMMGSAPEAAAGDTAAAEDNGRISVASAAAAPGAASAPIPRSGGGGRAGGGGAPRPTEKPTEKATETTGEEE